MINLTNLILLYLLFFNILTSREQQLKCLKAIVAGASLGATLGILQYFGIDVFGILPDMKGQRTGSTLGNADYTTPVILLALPLALAFVLKRISRQMRIQWRHCLPFLDFAVAKR